MPENTRKRQRRTSFTFWTLLFYIIAALVWWYISLEKQSNQLAEEQFKNLEIKRTSLTPERFIEYQADITTDKIRNTRKYTAEGVTFLLLILTGAVIVFRSIRKQFRLQQQQQNFMMAVTHELKTPIAVAKLNLETLQKYNLDPEKQKKIIRTTLDETARLNFLTNNILISAQLEGNRFSSDKEELDLSSLLKDCVRDFKNRFPDRVFAEQIEGEADIRGDQLLLQILINNLLENAIKYSPKEKPITATLKKIKTGIALQIIDEGSGISEAEKLKIFNKFYRVGNESTRKTQGTGLGLYLCRKIALDHNANIKVTNNEQGGSNFTVIFKS